MFFLTFHVILNHESLSQVPQKGVRDSHDLFIKNSWGCAWVFVAARAFSSCGTQGLLSSCGPQAYYWQWPLCRGALALERAGRGSCGTQAWLLPGMWSFPGLGIEPVSPALAGGFLTTGPPGKSSYDLMQLHHLTWYLHLSYIGRYPVWLSPLWMSRIC